MNGFTKLFGSLITSTVWSLPDSARVVWVTMLALADQDGFVAASVPGLAKVAGVSREACDQALALFLAPDPDSRTKENEGRRIAPADGGWTLLNHGKYRDLLSSEDLRAKAAERQARLRARRRGRNVTSNAPSRSVTPSNVTSRSVTESNASNDKQNASASASEFVSGSDLSEGESAREGTEKPSTLRYREAYAKGIAAAKGSPWVWPPGPDAEWSDKDLGLAIATFAKSRSTKQPLRGDKLTGWITGAAEDFVRHVLEAGDDPKFWSHFKPKGLVRFLNQEVRTEEARLVG